MHLSLTHSSLSLELEDGHHPSYNAFVSCPFTLYGINLPKVPSYIGLGLDKSDTHAYHRFKCGQIGTKPEL